jgi:hypothetical protein
MPVAVIPPATEPIAIVEPQEDLEEQLDLDIPETPKVSANYAADTLRATELSKVVALVEQAQFVMASFEAIQGAEDPDKEWKSWLKEESHGDLTPKQAEKLIFLVEALKESLPTLRQFSVSGLLEWSQLPGKEIREVVLAIAEAELMEYLTAKVIKEAYGIYQVENSQHLPDSLKKELNALSGPPRVKVRKKAAAYVKAIESLEGSSEDIDAALKSSLEKRVKQSDPLTGLKEALPDLKAVKGLLDHTESLENVESVILEAVKEDCLTEAAKLVDRDLKRNLGVRDVMQLSLELEEALTEIKDVKGPTLSSIADEVARSGKRNNFKLKMKDNQVLHVQLELELV